MSKISFLHHRSDYNWLKVCVFSVLVVGLLLSRAFSTTALAQAKQKKTTQKVVQKPPAKTPARPAKKATKSDDEPQPPENIVLETKDGVRLNATFFPGTKGNQSVPVILLHMWKGSRGDYNILAPYLQRLGHAVLVPDLRGHGESIHARGASQPLEADKLPSQQFLRMVDCDMETLKKFLMEKNNEGELNIDKLCIVGSEMGAVVALDWARMDWSWPPLNTGKQGQDVKALVLISPQWAFHGLSAKRAMALRPMLHELSTMILVGGENSRAVQQAKRFEAIFRRYSPGASAEKDPDRTLWYIPLKTSLQGTKMLGSSTLRVEPGIAKFIKWRLVDQSFPWKNRDPNKQ
ncbi:MAG: alpha/beta fold hydrolase [Pirellulales bacterium]|nr:alpha/beta fold hydrolase [Pirellulales bacterium]